MADLVVDSSVWIDFFNKKSSIQINELNRALSSSSSRSPFNILPVIMQEVLQGIVDKKLYDFVKENLFGFDLVEYDNYEMAISAADLFRFLRLKGVTIRKANDCLIAAICIQNKFSLLHNDKDFNNIAKYTSLKIYK